jgi:hypothetical protein
MIKDAHQEQSNQVEEASTQTQKQNASNEPGSASEAEVRYADTATIIESLKSAIAQHAFTFALFCKQTHIEYRFGYGSSPQELLTAAENLCAEGYDFWGGATSADRTNWSPFVFNLCRTNCPKAFITDQLDRALARQLAN